MAGAPGGDRRPADHHRTDDGGVVAGGCDRHLNRPTDDSGNPVGNNTAFVWNDDLRSGSGLDTNTRDEVIALYADAEIKPIVLIVDESSGEQTVVLDPCISLASDETG